MNTTTMAANTITFPSGSPAPSSLLPSEASAETRQSALSHLSRHVTALEICELVYSGSVPSWEAIERFYESNAIYENPLVTATSRKLIADIHTVAGQLARIDVPRPTAILYALFGVESDDPDLHRWFGLLRAWSEAGDVSESESFGEHLPVMLRHPSPLVLVFTPICTDGHRKVIVEHTLHIVLLPGLHSGVCQPGPPHTTIAERTLSVSSMTSGPTSLGLDLSLPSPLHLRLPIISRLSFNESGKITHHRDFWDLKVRNHMLPLESPG